MVIEKSKPINLSRHLIKWRCNFEIYSTLILKLKIRYQNRLLVWIAAGIAIFYSIFIHTYHLHAECDVSPAPTNAISESLTLNNQGGELTFDGARIVIPKGAIQEPVPIQIQRLKNENIPPLDPLMINVTAGGGGYRFLPKGMTFKKPVSVEIPIKDSYG